VNHLAYLDTSAFIKLLITEDETPALPTALTDWPDLVASEILFVEAHLATAEALGDDLGVIFRYDRRMLSDGLLEGLAVRAPSST